MKCSNNFQTLQVLQSVIILLLGILTLIGGFVGGNNIGSILIGVFLIITAILGIVSAVHPTKILGIIFMICCILGVIMFGYLVVMTILSFNVNAFGGLATNLIGFLVMLVTTFVGWSVFKGVKAK